MVIIFIIILDLSITSSNADIDDYNLYYNFNSFKNSGRNTNPIIVTEVKNTKVNQFIPTLSFGGGNNERIDNNYNNSNNNTNKQKMKNKSFVSERETKMNDNNIKITSEREIKLSDRKSEREYSFSEDYRENNEENKAQTKNNINNSNNNKFSLNLAGKGHGNVINNSNSDNNNDDNYDENSNNNNVNVQGLNFENLKRGDFNDEFIQNYEDFSPSWRKECDKINLRKKN